MTDLDMINLDQPDDTDSSAMMRHAYARERRLETYDPHRLAREIAELPRERGLHLMTQGAQELRRVPSATCCGHSASFLPGTTPTNRPTTGDRRPNRP